MGDRQDYQRYLSQITGGRVVAYWPVLAQALGSVNAALMLSQLYLLKNLGANSPCQTLPSIAETG